jgi:hypothetical protein
MPDRELPDFERTRGIHSVSFDSVMRFATFHSFFLPIYLKYARRLTYEKPLGLM